MESGKAQAARPESDLFYDAFKASPIGIALEDMEGQPLFVNPALCTMLGYSEEEMRSKHCVDFSPPEDAKKDWSLFEQLRKGLIDHYQIEKRFFRRDGSLVWGRLSISLLNGGPSPLVIAMVEDITEKKKTEETLRASEERLRMAQSAARIGTFEWNIGTGVNTCTPELEAMYGLPPGGFGGTQAAFQSLVHPDDRTKVVELVDDAMKTGRPKQGEWRVIWPDGSVHWIAARWQAFMNESGEPSRMIGVNIDITEQRLTLQELARVKERLHFAIEAGSVGGWDYDLESGVNVFFGKAHDQLGMSPGETSGSRQEFWYRVHEDDREHLQHVIRIAREKHEAFNEDFRVVWRDGTIRWLRSRGQYHYSGDGQPVRFLGISVDITDSKQAEQALRDTDQRFRLATEIGKMYSFEWDVTTDVVVRSPEHAKTLGATEPLRFSHQQFVNTIHPDDRPKFIATIAGLTADNPTAEVIYRVQVADGGLVWLKSSGRGFFDGEGRMIRVIGMVADVTDLKRAEKALSDMAGKLIEALEEERTRIARELHDDIGQRLAWLAWNLGSLRTYTSLTEVQGGIGRAIQEISSLDRDMRAMAYRLHSPRLEYLGLAGAASAYCSERSEQHNVDIDFYSEDLPKDLSREVSLCLFRVLQEAIQNAIKHSGSQRFDVSFSLTLSGMICLTVHDSGIGFDPAEPLKGRGLGLVSMKERLNLVGGELSIQSQPGIGTTIYACAPLIPRTNAAPAK